MYLLKVCVNLQEAQQDILQTEARCRVQRAFASVEYGCRGGDQRCREGENKLHLELLKKREREDNVEHFDHQDAKRKNPVRNKLKFFCCMN